MDRNGVRRWLWSAACVFAAGGCLRAGGQTAPAGVAFEVATVKPVIVDASHPFDPRHFSAHVYPARASYWSMTVEHLFYHAYGIDSFQVTGPAWADHDRFDVEARFPAGTDKKDEPLMLQELLRDRFKLAFHVEKRDLDGYVLVVGKHGERLKLSPPEVVNESVATKPGVTENPDGSTTVNMGKRGTETLKFDYENWTQHFERSRMTMEELAGRLGNCMGGSREKVVDETGMKGTYQVVYDCSLPGRPPSSGGTAAGDGLPADPQGVSALARSLEGMGLKLERRKMATDVYVIDHVERPTEN